MRLNARASSNTVLGFSAVPGYDLATGLGTADGAKLVATLAGDRHERARR